MQAPIAEGLDQQFGRSPHAAAEPPSAFSAPRSRRSSSPSCSALSPLLPGCLAASQGPTLRRRKAASAVRSGLSSGWAVILRDRAGRGSSRSKAGHHSHAGCSSKQLFIRRHATGMLPVAGRDCRHRTCRVACSPPEEGRHVGGSLAAGQEVLEENVPEEHLSRGQRLCKIHHLLWHTQSGQRVGWQGGGVSTGSSTHWLPLPLSVGLVPRFPADRTSCLYCQPTLSILGGSAPAASTVAMRRARLVSRRTSMPASSFS